MNVIDLVRQTTKIVTECATHVKLNENALHKTGDIIAKTIKEKVKEKSVNSLIESLFIEWDNDTVHYRFLDKPELTCQYIMVLSSCNFCFWPFNDKYLPNDEFEYHHFASSLRDVLLNDSTAFDAKNLQTISEEKLINEWFKGKQIPLVGERVRLIREVGFTLEKYFNGKAYELINQSSKSVKNLVDLVTRYFPGFRDSCIYSPTGQQIHFYKRAQIFCADIYGCFNGKGIGEFTDVDQLTMFADYRVPQILSSDYYLKTNGEDAGSILVYSEELDKKLEKFEIFEYSSQMEVEIRACTVQAVELLRDYLYQKHGIKCLSIEIDWLLWQIGEANRLVIKPHHRTLSIFY
ncbi:hypothetical protein ABK040_004107 [Willaertia magna]